MGLFSKKKKLTAPVGGTLMALDQVSDEVFSSGMMGPGFAVEPHHNHIYSPVNGTVTTLFPTKHAIGIKAGELEILVHLGIDTVELDGVPFSNYVAEGDQVTTSTPIAFMDRGKIGDAGKRATVMVLVTNGKDCVKDLKLIESGQVSKEQVVAVATLK